MYLELENLFEDVALLPGQKPADDAAFSLCVDGDQLIGCVYVPSGHFTGLRPCVCLFHGFPGICSNDDIARALCRTGCVVIRPFHRGAWGSGGKYSFSNCVEDAVATARWAMTDGAAQYSIDTKRIFLAGHSVGGQTVLNAARQLPEILGTVLIAPYSMATVFKSGATDEFRQLMELHTFLHTDGPEALYKNASENWKDMDFVKAAEDMKQRNILILAGSRDSAAVPSVMVDPLWEALQPTGQLQQLVVIDDEHSFSSNRTVLIKEIAKWVDTVCRAV